MKYVRLLCWLLMFGALGYNLYFWGGIAHTPEFDARLDPKGTVKSPLGVLYLSAGKQTVGVLGKQQAAIDFASDTWDRAFPSPKGDPLFGMQALQDALSEFQRACYYGVPLLFVLGLLLVWLRPKAVRSFGT